MAGEKSAEERKLLFVFGTRPEAIKLAPLILECQRNKRFNTLVCITGQHREMLDQVLSFYNIRVDADLNVMTPNQTLASLTSHIICGVDRQLLEFRPDLVFVQGDTNTAFSGALAAAYRQCRVAHIEAGLRSHDRTLPFPEEINRLMIAQIAYHHFAPTEAARSNLLREGVSNNAITVVGNTAIDALYAGLVELERSDSSEVASFFSFLDGERPVVLVTAHRRESFGSGLQSICEAIKVVAARCPDVQFVYPVHPNPNVSGSVVALLKEVPGVFLTPPLPYPSLLWLLNRSRFVMTDSGGLQEEAPSIGKPVLVLRDVTERPEGIAAGTSKLVGTDKDRIVDSAVMLLKDGAHYFSMAKRINSFGDGNASKRIVSCIDSILK